MNKTKKIGIATLAVGSVLTGGVAFGSADAHAAHHDAKNHGFPLAFRIEACDMSDLERGGEAWKAQAEICKTERDTAREAFKNMTEEERKAHKEALKSEWEALSDEEKQSFLESGPRHPGRRGGMFPPKIRESVDRTVTELSNGIQITITSDDAETIEKLHHIMQRMQDRIDNTK